MSPQGALKPDAPANDPATPLTLCSSLPWLLSNVLDVWLLHTCGLPTQGALKPEVPARDPAVTPDEPAGQEGSVAAMAAPVGKEGEEMLVSLSVTGEMMHGDLPELRCTCTGCVYGEGEEMLVSQCACWVMTGCPGS
jgi:hypothetical protein